MDTTAHKPYVEFEDGNRLPVLGFREKSTGTKPLVPKGNRLVLAENYHEEKKEYKIVVGQKELIHG